mgnify:CR=1 FL=1
MVDAASSRRFMHHIMWSTSSGIATNLADFEVFALTENMRVEKEVKNPGSDRSKLEWFAMWLLRVGNGEEEHDESEMIALPPTATIRAAQSTFHASRSVGGGSGGCGCVDKLPQRLAAEGADPALIAIIVNDVEIWLAIECTGRVDGAVKPLALHRPD